MFHELEECIKDSLEDAMATYVKSSEYHERQQHISRLYDMLYEALDIPQRDALRNLVDAVDHEFSTFSHEAYFRGVVSGISLRKKVFGDIIQ